MTYDSFGESPQPKQISQAELDAELAAGMLLTGSSCDANISLIHVILVPFQSLGKKDT